MKLEHMRPARVGMHIPMPDRGFAPMPADGLPVDIEDPWWMRLLADGDIAPPAPQPPPPPPRKR